MRVSIAVCVGDVRLGAETVSSCTMRRRDSVTASTRWQSFNRPWPHELTRARTAAKQPLPATLQRQLAAAQCLVEQRKKAAAAPADDGSEAFRVTRQRLRAQEQRHQALLHAAQAARRAREDQPWQRIAEADRSLVEAREAASEAQRQRDERAEEALRAQAVATSPSSATVLADLISNDVGARTKWIGITARLLTLEGMPLILKALRGRSVVGARLVLSRRSKLANEDAACERSRLQAVTETQLAAAPHVELDEALASADLHLHFKEQALTTLRAAAPIEPMIRQTRKMEAGELAVRRHLAAYPSPRSVPAQAGAIGPHRA